MTLIGGSSHFSANACLAPICSLHHVAVTTVEGIGSTKTRLHPVQVTRGSYQGCRLALPCWAECHCWAEKAPWTGHLLFSLLVVRCAVGGGCEAERGGLELAAPSSRRAPREPRWYQENQESTWFWWLGRAAVQNWMEEGWGPILTLCPSVLRNPLPSQIEDSKCSLPLDRRPT